MSRLAPYAFAGLIALVAAAPAAAQERYGGYGDAWGQARFEGGWRDSGYRARDWNAVPSTFDWRSQLDRPGDYRCDAYWDAGRPDCHERWRDQRHRVSPQARRDYSQLAGRGLYDGDRHSAYGYGYGYGRGSSYGYGDAYRWRGRGYGSAYAFGHGSGGTTWHGAYGRPDHVFPGGGRSYGGRDAGRIAWCRARYRSYDPDSGYYRAWSGRLVWCG